MTKIDYKEIKRLVDEGMSSRQVAHQTGVSQKTVIRVKLLYGIKTLLDCLVKMSKSESDFNDDELRALDYLQRMVDGYEL